MIRGWTIFLGFLATIFLINMIYTFFVYYGLPFGSWYQNTASAVAELVAPDSSAASSPSPDAYATDRGIIIPVTDASISLAVSLVRQLRCLGNDDAIGLYHCGKQLPSRAQDMVSSIDTSTQVIDVCQSYISEGYLSVSDMELYQNEWVKPLALIHSRARNVILMEPGVVPVVDPSVVRDLEDYKDTGAVFFYDHVRDEGKYFNAPIGSSIGLRGRRTNSWLNHTLSLLGALQDERNNDSAFSHLQTSLAYTGITGHEQNANVVYLDKLRHPLGLKFLWRLSTMTRFHHDFSYADHDVYWLSMEFAREKYTFSPWSSAAVSSSTNGDMKEHPDTLCGAIAQYMPVNVSDPGILFVNGKSLLEPYPAGVRNNDKTLVYNPKPSHITPPSTRRPREETSTDYPAACLVHRGSTPLSTSFLTQLLVRRSYFLAAQSGLYSSLSDCTLSEELVKNANTVS